MGHWVEMLVCITVPRTLPTHSKGGIRLLGTNCQAWVGMSAQKHILVGFASWKSRTIPTCKQSCCQHQACHPAKLLPSPSQKGCLATTYPKDTLFFQRDECLPNTSQQSSLMKVG